MDTWKLNADMTKLKINYEQYITRLEKAYVKKDVSFRNRKSGWRMCIPDPAGPNP